MYEYLKGEIVDIFSDSIVVEVSNIGYKILTANPYAYSQGENTLVYTYFNVREDVHELYGFKTKEVRDLFLKLIKVNGVGPKSALAIIATDDIHGLINAIEKADVSYLTKFPKLGAKTASKVILELKGKLQLKTDDDSPLSENRELADALEALSALGYKDKDIKSAKKALKDSNLTTNEYIKKALKIISG